MAPSPTGALHLGNVRTFLVNWALARQRAWHLWMRIEDLDGPRIKTDAAERTLELLSWLGLDHDGSILVQSNDLDPYRAALHRLAEQGAVYRCDLTRRQIAESAAAPHADEHELVFPVTLRPNDPRRFEVADEPTNYRLVVPDEPVEIEDAVAGAHTFRPAREIGDFVVWTRRGTPAYQLAVVVDDIRQEVTDVVRGEDLLPSAARQTLLYRLLDAPPPRWHHLPLVLGPDGRRLAKRHGDSRVERYRDEGVPARRIMGLLGWWCGIGDRPTEMSADAFRDRFEVARLPRDPVTFRPEDERWLLERA